MSFHAAVKEEPGLAPALEIRQATVDDFSSIRYIHTRAFERWVAPVLSEEEANAVLAYMRSPPYAFELMSRELFVGRIAGQIVATAGWSAGDDSGSIARIGWIFVDPMFAGCGIGKRLVADVEARAAQSGYSRFAIRATPNAAGFCQRLGYEIASHGVSTLYASVDALPVTFMRKSLERVLAPIAEAAGVDETSAVA